MDDSQRVPPDAQRPGQAVPDAIPDAKPDAMPGMAGWRPDRCHRIAMVLQGGGALGAYQAGVYEAMHAVGMEPDWVSGVSIGAINAAIIAGNPPERRIERLQEFWQRITKRTIWAYTPDGDIFRTARNAASAFETMLLGQPGFFKPRSQNPWLNFAGAEGATSYYDTGPLRETLLELVDFDLINSKAIRFSVGAVNVLTGNFLYFDNETDTITPEHVMASGALPPALPMVKIGSDYYWDGGIVSNTPLMHLLEQEDRKNAIVFQVDLFSARGPLPKDMQDVAARQKDIMYSSRTRYTTEFFSRIHQLKVELFQALSRIPDSLRTAKETDRLADLENQPEMTILQLIYQQKSYEGDAKDYEFSATSMREHWQSGLEDTRRSMKRPDWLEIPPDGSGVVVHDVHRDFDH